MLHIVIILFIYFNFLMNLVLFKIISLVLDISHFQSFPLKLLKKFNTRRLADI